MPEILTRYPGIVTKILNDTGVAKCGRKGANKKILKLCPNKSFCSLPTGELCVYDYKNVGKMTQLTVKEIVMPKLSNKKK